MSLISLPPALRGRHEPRLPQLLLIASLAEMTIYRLMVPLLRPAGDAPPPLWHSGLAYLGLFLFYFTSALAFGLVAQQLGQILRRWEPYPRVLSMAIPMAGTVFLACAFASIVAAPSTTLTFVFEASFATVVLALLLAQLLRRGDIGARLGLFLLAIPLLVHFWVPFNIFVISGEEKVYLDGLADRIDFTGRWLVLFAALTMPYCFGARPFFLRAARLAPMLAALVVGFFGALVIRHDYGKGMEIAQNGLGFSVGPGAPSSLIALALLALSAVTWTVVNCLSAPSAARREIGVGISLVVVGGYAFAWPLQFLVGLCGLLVISRSTARVQGEEMPFQAARVPAVDDETWQAYLEAVLQVFHDRHGKQDGKHSVVTVRGEGMQSRSHFVCGLKEVDGLSQPVTVTIERVSGSIVGLDVRIGDGSCEDNPAFSLHPYRPNALGVIHPSPPMSGGHPMDVDDSEMVERFHLLTDYVDAPHFLSEPVCERLRNQCHGWIAIWPSTALRAQVYPGRGAPLEAPIPTPELGRGRADADWKPSAEALVDFIELLAEVRSSYYQVHRGRDTDKARE